MARVGLWLAVLGLCYIVAEGNSVPDSSDPCKRFSRDGISLSIAEVFDMIFIQFNEKVRNMNTEVLREYMIYDVDHDNRFNMEECNKVVEALNKLDELK